MQPASIRANALGEHTAEYDTKNLDDSFIETPEYRSILETKDRCVVVGRRGTGKSAMFWKLNKFWSQQKSSHVIQIAPEDYQTIGFRGLFSSFQGKYSHIRAAARIIWKYSILMEMLNHLSKSYKTRNLIGERRAVSENLKRWGNDAAGMISHATVRIAPLLKKGETAEGLIGGLPQLLDLHQLEQDFEYLVHEAKINFYILIDRLDEGFENDEVGAAIVSGAVTAISDINKRYQTVRPVLFLRDNVNRSISRFDPDYTRNIEGEILRIHWDQFQLLNLVSRRLDKAFDLNIQNDQKVWDRCTADEGQGRELKGRDGFRKCLQFTLYRPRDLLSLLNQSFYQAGREDRATIILRDVEQTAKTISETRLEDLQKEYSAIFPSVAQATRCFANGSPELTSADALAKLDALSTTAQWRDDPQGQQDYLILKSEGLLRALYSVGFLGIHDPVSNTFAFCHDGRSPDKEFQPTDRVLIHPCYWISLNLTRNAFTADEAEQINDEYEIKVTSQTPEIRATRIGSIIADLGTISEGRDDSEDFELWVENAIQTVFAGHLDNVERKPNGANTQRRDVVALNLCRTPAFTRIHNDYKSRQVIFEVKNYRDIGRDEYRQMLSYLHDRYGDIGFIVTRDEDENLHAGKELDWVRELYTGHKKLVVRITAKFLQKLLGKLRSPEKHDVVDKAVNSLLDQYERRYLGIQSSGASKTSKQRSSK
ncbi:MAG: ATP-binding protein [Hylemonella sp.]|nr:ATP-binding protein [Hylemonella sp.]